MADSYEQEDDGTTTAHYAQLAVPGHDLAIPAKLDGDQDLFQDANGGTVTPSGNSFLRLGVSPVTVSYANSLFSMTTDGTEPTGFDTSLTLAKLVGNMDSGSGGGTDTVASAEGTSDTSKGSGYYTEDPYQGDSLLGFADDTRVRDDASDSVLYLNGAARTNSQANRRTETYRLLSKGGWWDHSDGNRISTTVGDKVEIIQGNYKLVVLGRRAADDTSDKKVTDVSGGYELSKKYEYLTTDEVWATWEKSSKAHATKVSSGKDISYFKGSDRKTYVGKHPDGSEEKPDVYTENHLSSQTTKTWAKTVETYTGSADDPVTHSLALTYAHFMEDVRFGETMMDVRFFAEHMTARSAGLLQSWNLAGINLATFNIAPTVWKVDIAPQTFETKLGIDWKIAAKKTGVWLNDADMTVKKDLLAATVTEMRTYAAQVAATAIRLANDNTSFYTNSKTLAVLAQFMATTHFFL